jgi:rhomboid protease GluP
LNEATVDWLTEPAAGAGISVAAYLVEREQWNVLQNFPKDSEPCLMLGSSTEGVILLPSEALTVESMERQHQWWLENLKKLPKGWRNITILYLVDSEPSKEVIGRVDSLKKKTFLSRTVKSVVVDTQNGNAYGQPGQTLSRTLQSRTPCGLLELHGKLMVQDQKLQGFSQRLQQTKAWGTYLLIALCCFVFGWATLAGGTEQTLILLRFGANYAPLTVGLGQWWRLIGACFLHIGWVHLAVNMYSLYVVGPTLEKFLGNLRYLAVYSLAGICGSLASAYFGGGHISAGASGAIFGLFGACVTVGYRYRATIPRPIRQSLAGGMLPAIVYNLIYGFSSSGIDNSAHLGGLMAGGMAAYLIEPKVLKQTPQLPVRTLCAALATVLFFVQGMVLVKAVPPFELAKLPSQRVELQGWSVEVPSLFTLSEDGSYYEGPGINLLFLVQPAVPSPQPVDPKLNEDLLSRLVGFTVTYDETVSVNGETWHLYSSSGEVAGNYAVRQENHQRFILSCFSAPELAWQAKAMVKSLLSTVKNPSTPPTAKGGLQSLQKPELWTKN